MQDQPLTIQPQPHAEPSVSLMLQSVVERGVTAENVAVMEQLIGLKERMDAKQAEKDFAAAFVKLQADMPRIEPTRGIPDKFGKVKFQYAPFEEIMRKVRPLLTQHGFTLTFDSDFADGRVTVTCKLQHVCGHKTETRHAARVGSGPINSSEAQADGAAQTYAKRYALCSALNIVIEHDTDAESAKNQGDFITTKQAAELRERCEELGANKPMLLAIAGAANFEEIYSCHLDLLHRQLDAKQKTLGK
jgi:hypothetical protein